MRRYEYIGRRYGIRPVVGERVRSADSGKDGTVRHPSTQRGQYVRVQMDGEKRVGLWHPRDLIYLDRPAIASMYDPETGYAIKETPTA